MTERKYENPKQSSLPVRSPAGAKIPPATPAPGRPAATNLPALQLPRPPLFRELQAAQDFLTQISERVHILSPVVNIDYIPEFHELSVRYIQVDPRLNQYKQSLSGDVYVQKGGGGEVSLTKSALDRIAGAAGIAWHPTLSGRLDNASDPHYCHFRAVGIYRDLDGTQRLLTGEKEIDLRDGNPSIFTTDRKRMKRKWVNGQTTNEIENEGYIAGWSAERLEGAREHILAMAESKAKNRVVRSLGIKQKYNPQELTKPFAVMKLVMTGRSQSPELELEAKKLILRDALEKSRGMFGGDTGSLRIERDVTPRHEAPPLGKVEPDDDDDTPPADETIDVSQCSGCPDGPAGAHVAPCPLASPDWGDV